MRFSIRRAFCGLLFLFSSLSAAEIPRTSPESVGMSAERLQRVQDVLQEYVDKQKVSGVVSLILRDGRIVQELNVGVLDLESKTPMPVNAIFRIASMTKPITSVAVMMLVEEGKLLLSDPLSRHLPEFVRTTVAVRDPVQQLGYRVEPAAHPITLHQLLTHTSGISYGGGPARELYQEEQAYNWYFAEHYEPIGSVIRRLAELPFDAPPGQRFIYGFSSDVLGHVVEVTTGLELDQFFQQRILDPLGMVDSYFYLPPEKLDRFASVYAAQEGGGLGLVDGSVTSPYVTGPRTAFSGGAGLLSTARDYARFLQMLLNGGELEGRRILSPKTVQLMTVNHVKDLFDGGDRGFGLGFMVVQDLGAETTLGSPGTYGWGGAYYTTFWVDPAEQLVAVFMAQLIPSRGLDLQAKFRNLVYQAIEESHVKVTP